MRGNRRSRRPVSLRRSGHRGRTGIVLGGGGVLGAAWMAGALSAVQVQLTRPVGDAEVLVGTSVGSIVAAVLRSGFCTDDLVAHQRGSNDSVLSALCAPDLGCASGPPWPLSPVGSPRLLWKALLAPRTVHPWVIAAACLPRGRADHRELRSMVDGLPRTHQSAGQTWLTAVDYGSGRRVVFGRAGDPAASLADAVVASCSVPGWYRPTDRDRGPSLHRRRRAFRYERRPAHPCGPGPRLRPSPNGQPRFQSSAWAR